MMSELILTKKHELREMSLDISNEQKSRCAIHGEVVDILRLGNDDFCVSCLRDFFKSHIGVVKKDG